MRIPFSRSGTVRCSLPSSNSSACSGAPIHLASKRPATLIELAEMRRSLLNDRATNTNAARGKFHYFRR